MNELDLIRHFRQSPPTHPWLAVGPGQDCAVLRPPGGRDQTLKIDQIVEGTHFLLEGPEAATPKQVGWKAMAKACSDIAAAGGWPIAALVAVNLERGRGDAVALGLYEGIAACCERYGVALAGGDISTSQNKLSVSVALVGDGPLGGSWLRSGARPGDILLVTGALGGSRGGKHLDFTPRLEEAKRIRELAPNGVHACIDITDGLARDLRHICEESACGALIRAESVPISPDALSRGDGRSGLQHALEDGEDFELLLALEPAAASALLKGWDSTTPLTRIGEIRAAEMLIENAGVVSGLANVGYEHRV